MLRLPRISGDARLEWTLPASVLTDDWERGATRTFDIQVIPDEDAFAADDAHLLNLGTGGEPGRAQGRDVDSRNDDYGSLTGYPYPNNDWSRAIVARPGDGDSMYGKMLTRPWTRGTTLFDTASMEFSAAASEIGIGAEAGFDTVAVNTQVRTHLLLAPRPMKPKPGMSLTVDDQWLPGEQRWEGDLKVTQGDVTLTQGVDYDVQWTASGEPSKAPQSGCLQVADGWTDGLPTDGDTSVRGLRVILHDTDAVALETDAQSIDVSFVVCIAKSVGNDDASGDHRVNDWMTMRWTRNDDASMTGCSPNGVWVTTPQVGVTGVADLPPIVWHARVSNRATGVIQVTAGFTVITPTRCSAGPNHRIRHSL